MSFHIIHKEEKQKMSFPIVLWRVRKIGYLCSIELFQIRFNYTVSLTFTGPNVVIFICMLFIEIFIIRKSDDCMLFKGFLNKIFVSHSHITLNRLHSIYIFLFHFSEMKNAENGVVKLWIESWCERTYVDNQFFNIDWLWTHEYI